LPWLTTVVCIIVVGATLSTGEKAFSASLALLDTTDKFQSVAEAMSSYKDCTNDAEECQDVGAVAMTNSWRCFTICVGYLTGCRSCCDVLACYTSPSSTNPWGTCGLCASVPALSDRLVLLSADVMTYAIPALCHRMSTLIKHTSLMVTVKAVSTNPDSGCVLPWGDIHCCTGILQVTHI
jgi:hypothetical protein